jgi:hypothetical protein
VDDSTQLDVGIDGGTPVGAPVRWLIGAALCVITAFALSVGSQPALWLGGWAAGGFGTVGLIALFTLADSRRRANAWYIIRPAITHARVALIALAAVAVGINAWRFADWMSRR